jgi:hypothetical protein
MKTRKQTTTQAKVEKFDLMKVDNKQLIHVNEWEQKLKKLVKENPFVAITDKESYNLAKSRKAVLKNARLELRTTGKKESQESILMTKINGIKSFVKDAIDKLVAIPTTPEDLQQDEIDRYDLILEAEKNEADRLEGIRTDAIKTEIERIKGVLQETIDGSSFATLVDDELAFRLLTTSGFDFQEFDFLFEEMIEKMTKEFNDCVIWIKKTEEKRLEELTSKIESKLNQMIVDGQQLVDEIDGTIDEKLLKQMTSGIFQTMIGCDVEFDQASIEKMEAEKQKVLTKISEKISLIKQQEITEQRERIIEVREGLLDIVFGITVDNMAENTNYIKESLDQEVLPELEAEFLKMKTRVETSLTQKLEALADEITKAEQAEEIRMQGVMESRTKIILGLGMVQCESETELEWTGFGLTITDERLYQEDDIETIVDEINEAKLELEVEAKAEETLKERINKIESIGLVGDTGENQWDGFGCSVIVDQLKMVDDEQMDELVVYLENAKKADKEENDRQELLKKDKASLELFIIEIQNEFIQFDTNIFKNAEMKGYFEGLKKEFITYSEEKINNLNKF